MSNLKGRSKWLLALITVFCVSGYAGGAIAAASKDWKMPKMVKVATHEVGTANHLLGSLILETMVEVYSPRGVTVRGIPQGAEVPRSMMGRTGTVDCVLQAGHTVYAMQEGLLTFGSLEWGPQPLRAIYMPSQPPMVIGVRKDSGIKTFADLKGKKVDYLPASPATNWALDALLAYGGLTRKDVESITFTSRGESYEAVLEGRTNFGSWNIDAPQAYELIEMGGYYLPMEVDSPNWKRVYAKYPMFRPTVGTNGAGASPEKPVVGLGQSNAVWFCWPDRTSDDITYFLTRAIYETYDTYKTKHASLKLLFDPKEHWKNWEGPSGLIPLAEGSIKYFKEIGEWTPEREKLQQERLAYQAKLAKYWDEVGLEAQKEKIKSKDFFKFWLKKKTEAGLPDLN